MEQRRAIRASGRSRAVRTVVVFTAVWLVGAACGSGPSPSVEEGGWSGVTILCGYRESDDPLRRVPAGRVVGLGREPAALLARARCGEGARGRGGAPEVRADRWYGVVGYLGDRHDVRLVGVDRVDGDGRVRLEVEHDVTGPGCGETSEYRGQLLLLVAGPAGSPTPSVEVRQVELPC